jgi:hypothetical protein
MDLNKLGFLRSLDMSQQLGILDEGDRETSQNQTLLVYAAPYTLEAGTSKRHMRLNSTAYKCVQWLARTSDKQGCDFISQGRICIKDVH